MAQSLARHIEDIRHLVFGTVLYGEKAEVEVVYGIDPNERAAIVKNDLARLIDAGFVARIVGRNSAVAVSLTNVGTPLVARFVK